MSDIRNAIGVLVAVSLWVLVWACPPNALGTQETPERDWAVYARGEVLGILQLSPLPLRTQLGSDDLRFSRLERVGDRLVPGKWTLVCKFRRMTGGHRRFAAQPLSNGGWAIVYTEMPGGSRALQYLEIDADLLNLPAPPETHPESITSLRLVDQQPDERPRIRDLGEPRILERRGEVYLLGESYLGGDRSPQAYAVWIAPAKTVQDPRLPGRCLANGRIIAYAQNPRAVKFGNQFVVAAQNRRPNTALAWGMPVRLYVSTDLENWKPFPAPADTLEFYDYDLRVTRHGLTLVGIVDTSKREKRGPPSPRKPYAPPLAMVTLVYDAPNESWRTLATRPDGSLNTSSEIKLLPVDSDRAELKLIERGADGRFTTKSVDEQ